MFSTFEHLLSLVPTTDCMCTSVSLLKYGLLSIGNMLLRMNFYHPGALALVGETDIHINNPKSRAIL